MKTRKYNNRKKSNYLKSIDKKKLEKAIAKDRVKGLRPLLWIMYWEIFYKKKADLFYDCMEKGMSERTSYLLTKRSKI